VDFFCFELMLAIEIDGSTHNEKGNYDLKRETEIENEGIRFLKFSDNQVKRNMEGVLLEIKEWINNNI
jgi:very-short-patch-repair endonuclease